MTELVDLARKHNLKIIEDASHAPGATWRGRRCGTLGDVSVFSLQASKLAPAGEGGMFLTNDDDAMERAVCLGDIDRIQRLKTPARRFAATGFGIKTRMAPLSAAVARVQFRHLEERNSSRNENMEYLSARLERLGLQTFLAPLHVRRVYFQYLIACPAAPMPVDLLVEALRAEGCHASLPRYPLLHQQPIFTEGEFAKILRLDGRADNTLPRYAADDLPRTTRANRELIHLPVFPRASRALLDQYASAFEKVLANARAIVEGTAAK
jgi:dTDP-4-amino-4,6-dideoxygalactose transaminase